MKDYDIIVLDTGVDLQHKELSNYNNIYAEYLEICGQKAVYDDSDIVGHGTAIVARIKKMQPEAAILCMRIFDSIDGKPVSSERRLIDALNYIEANYSVKVINISSSILAPTKMHELQSITKRLAAKGGVIVSAHDNAHSLSYPASFEWVIGVAVDTQRLRGTNIIIANDTVINVIDSLHQFQVQWKNEKNIMQAGSSFSCAKISALSLSYIKNGASNIQDVLQCFRQDYSSETDSVRVAMPTTPRFEIQKAVAFPCNKEIHSVIRFSENLTFELVDVYDVRQSFRVGRSTRDILSDDCVPEFFVKNINEIKWDSFDTLILGCVLDLCKLLGNSTWLTELVEKALNKNKNIYAFEDLSCVLDSSIFKNSRLFYPVIERENMPPARGGRLAQSAVSIVGVYGTASKQGKFTLQMKLRKEFQKMGCKVGQIGTEPSALLFGMDYVFPMGFNSTVYLVEEQKILYCNDLVRRISETNPDVILVGSQRDTVPKNFENVLHYCHGIYGFLQGVKPDFAFVTLSLTDTNEYILRTIDFLASLTETKTLAFALFPETHENENNNARPVTEGEFFAFKKRIEGEFNIPVFLLGEKFLAKNLIEILANELRKT